MSHLVVGWADLGPGVIRQRSAKRALGLIAVHFPPGSPTILLLGETLLSTGRSRSLSFFLFCLPSLPSVGVRRSTVAHPRAPESARAACGKRSSLGTDQLCSLGTPDLSLAPSVEIGFCVVGEGICSCCAAVFPRACSCGPRRVAEAPTLKRGPRFRDQYCNLYLVLTQGGFNVPRALPTRAAVTRI